MKTFQKTLNIQDGEQKFSDIFNENRKIQKHLIK